MYIVYTYQGWSTNGARHSQMRFVGISYIINKNKNLLIIMNFNFFDIRL